MFDYVYIENVTESRDGGDGRKEEKRDTKWFVRLIFKKNVHTYNILKSERMWLIVNSII